MVLRPVQIVPLTDVVEECGHTRTYQFAADLDARPGQFVMMWIPSHDELPMALSYLDRPKGVTIRAYGDATHALADHWKIGDLIGIRGPYGNGFAIEGKRALAVAGGVGVASVIAAIEAYAEAGKHVESAFGFRSKEEFTFVERAKRAGQVHLATDDGSAGHHGFVTDVAARLLDGGGFDMVLTCGPEVMMKKVVDAANERSVRVQASLERYMKCGIGICDACALDDRIVCVDGPVFWGEGLAKSNDFGRWRRDICGRREPV